MDHSVSSRAKRRVALSLAFAGIASAAWLTVGGTASAHEPLISATASCADAGGFVINYTASAWAGDGTEASRTNPSVRIDISVNNTNNTPVDSGAFSTPAFSFSGQFSVPAGTTSLQVFAVVVGTWGNGFPGGQSASTSVALPTDCTPPTTSTTTTSTTTSSTTSTTTTSTTTTTTTTLPPPGDDGCTPGYWKNHTESWQVYTPGQTVDSVFTGAGAYGLGTKTLLQALDGGGGSGTTGAASILLRAGTAALLNASHSGVDYPRTAASVIADVNAALASANRDTMLTLASALDADNNLGCTLN